MRQIKFDLINNPKTRTEAQSYCRNKYTDLATVDNMEDMNRQINTVDSGYIGSAWIGLERPHSVAVVSGKQRFLWTERGWVQEMGLWRTKLNAQSHCRDRYTDLASVRTEELNQTVQKKANGSNVRIGLFRDSWKWSDQNGSSFRYWIEGEPNILNGDRNCFSHAGFCKEIE
eukprot:XP_014011956.1 PREDICTED: macrophage mannose receptor 1-like [Salmo salar]